MPNLKRALKISAVLLFVFVSLPLCGRGMSTEFFRDNVQALCSPGFGGRVSGESSFIRTIALVKGHFEKAGLQPWGGTWTHSFECPDGRRGRNVVGFIPGTSGKWIVVGAYCDGLGVLEGRLYPGADSNASGVAALLALAYNAPRTPRDGIIFVAFDGHGADYAGARALLAELGRKKIRLMVNLDTMGSTLSPVEYKYKRYMIALGGEKYSKALSSCASLGRIKLYYDYYRSDRFTRLFYRKIGEQKVFLEAGVPAVLFTSGITLHTNKNTDTPETLDYEVLRARVLCISRWLLLISS